MKKILFCFQQVGGANALLPLIEQWQNSYDILITGRPLVCDNLWARNIAVTPYLQEGENDHHLLDLSPFEQFSPDCIITDTISFERAPDGLAVREFWEMAARKKIPSIAYMDCWWGYQQRFVTQGENETPILPDYIAVVDEFARKDFLDHGYPDEKIIVLGCPRFDALSELGRQGAQQKDSLVRKQLGMKEDGKLLLFVSQPLEKVFGSDAEYGFTEKTTLQALLRALGYLSSEERAKTRLLILLHPEENEKELSAVLSEYDEDIAFSFLQLDDPVPYVLAADLVIGMFSFLLAEAVIMRCPVISIQLNRKREEILVTNVIGATLSINDENELENLHSYLTDDACLQRLLLAQEKFAIVPGSTSKWLGFMTKIIAKNKD